MKIIFFVTRSEQIGGAILHVRDLCLALNQVGHNTLVIMGGTGNLLNDFASRGIRTLSLPKLKRKIDPIGDTLSIISFFIMVFKEKPDLISAHTSKAGIIAKIVGYILNVPTLYTPHCWAFFQGQKSDIFYETVERLSCYFANRIVCVSKWEHDVGIEKAIISKANSLVVHNGMPSIRPFPVALNDREPVVHIGTIARFEKQKDYKTLVEALHIIKDYEWRAKFFGDGPMRWEIEKMIQDLKLTNRIFFCSGRGDAAEFLASIDVFVLSSLWEGFPRSILEAMRAGLPCIATNVGGNKESVFNNWNGYIVEKKNPLQLSEMLKDLILNEDRRKLFGKRSLQLFENRFTFEIMFRNYLRLFDEVWKCHHEESFA